MRRWMRRRSTSSWVSPGPRVPMPPRLLAESRARPAAQSGAAGSAAGPARPAPCPPGCGRSGRRCRGSPRCGRRRAAEQLLEVALLRGVSSSSNTTVSTSTPRGTARAAPRPCPCRRRSPDRDGRGAARCGRPRRHRRCRRAATSSSRLALGVVRRSPARQRDADEHDALPEGAFDQRRRLLAHGTRRCRRGDRDVDRRPGRAMTGVARRASTLDASPPTACARRPAGCRRVPIARAGATPPRRRRCRRPAVTRRPRSVHHAS